MTTIRRRFWISVSLSPMSSSCERAVPDALADRLRDRLGLLVDLLQHERLVALLLGSLVVPVDLDLLALDLVARHVEEACAFRGDRDDLAVLDDWTRRVWRRKAAIDEARNDLAVTETDDERALETSADEQTGMVPVTDHEREVALELPVRLADGLDEVAMVVALDEVDDRLGVRLGGEDVALGLERLLELAVVLDDPVEDDRDLLVGRAGQRMGVLEADAAVRRPARVPDAGRRREPFASASARRWPRFPTARTVSSVLPSEQAETGGVVAAVLEPLEALHEQVLCAPPADISDDPAHPKLPSLPFSKFAPVLAAIGKAGLRTSGLAEPISRSTRAAMVAQRSGGVFLALRLRQDAHDGLGAGGADEHPPARRRAARSQS